MAPVEGGGSALLHGVALWVFFLGLRLRQQPLCETHHSHDPPPRSWRAGRNLECRSKHLLALGICTPAYAPLASASHVLAPRLGGDTFCSLGKSHAVGRDVELWSLLWWGTGGNNWGLRVNLPHTLSKINYIFSSLQRILGMRSLFCFVFMALGHRC